MEFLLENLDAGQLLVRLRKEYPSIKFEKHPTLNGFYAYGDKRDVLRMQKEVNELDRAAAKKESPKK